MNTRQSFRQATNTSPGNIVSTLDVRASAARVLITDPNHDWHEDVKCRLNFLCALEKGWDGYDAVPVSFLNASFALRVLEACCPINAPAPQIIPGAGGDLQLEWHLSCGDVEIHVLGPNMVHAWRETNATSSDGESFELSNDFTQIVGWIKELTECSNVPQPAAA